MYEDVHLDKMIVLWHSIIYLLGELKGRLTGTGTGNTQQTNQNEEFKPPSLDNLDHEIHEVKEYGLSPEHDKNLEKELGFILQKDENENRESSSVFVDEKNDTIPEIIHVLKNNELLRSPAFNVTSYVLIDLNYFQFELIDTCEQKFQSSRVDLFETSTISSDELSDAELKTTSLKERQFFVSPKQTSRESSIIHAEINNDSSPLGVEQGELPGVYYLKVKDASGLDPMWIKFCEKKANQLLLSPHLLQESLHHASSLLSACRNCGNIQNPSQSQAMSFVGQNQNGGRLQWISHRLYEEGSWVQSQFISDSMTLAVPCSTWPKVSEIIWPCKEAVTKAQKLGCHFVPTKSQNNNGSLQWRFCFDFPSQLLIHSLSDKWKHSFDTFKRLCHIYLMDTAMTDEIIRNILFQVVCDIPQTDMEEDEDKLGLLIAKLMQCLKSQNCPSFFQPEFNMVRSWSSNDRALVWQGALELQYSVQCPDIMGYISEGSECSSQRSHLPYLPSNINLTWLESLAAFNQISNFVPDDFSERQVEKLFMREGIMPLQLVEAVIHYVRSDGKFPLPVCLHTPSRQQFLNFFEANVPSSNVKLFADATKLLQGFLCLQYAILERMEEYFNEHPEEAVTIEYE